MRKPYAVRLLSVFLALVTLLGMLPSRPARAESGGSSWYIEPGMLPSGDYLIREIKAKLPYDYPPIAGMNFSTWNEKGCTVDADAPYTAYVWWASVEEPNKTDSYFKRGKAYQVTLALKAKYGYIFKEDLSAYAGHASLAMPEATLRYVPGSSHLESKGTRAYIVFEGYSIPSNAVFITDRDTTSHHAGRKGVYAFTNNTEIYDKPGRTGRLVCEMKDIVYPQRAPSYFCPSYDVIETVLEVAYREERWWGKIQYFEPSYYRRSNPTFDPSDMKTGWVYLGMNCSCDATYRDSPENPLYSVITPHLLYHPDVGKGVQAGKAKMVNAAWSVKRPDGITSDYTEGESNGWHYVGKEVEIEYTVWNHSVKDEKYYNNGQWSKNFPVGWCKLKNSGFVRLEDVRFLEALYGDLEGWNSFEVWELVCPDGTDMSNRSLALRPEPGNGPQSVKIPLANYKNMEFKVYTLTSGHLLLSYKDQSENVKFGYLYLYDTFMADGSYLMQYEFPSVSGIRLRRVAIVKNGVRTPAEFVASGDERGTWAAADRSSGYQSGGYDLPTGATYTVASGAEWRRGPGELFPKAVGGLTGNLYLADVLNGCWGRFQKYNSDGTFSTTTAYLNLSKYADKVTKKQDGALTTVMSRTVEGTRYSAKRDLEVHRFADRYYCGYGSDVMGVIPRGSLVYVTGYKSFGGSEWGTVKLSNGSEGDVPLKDLEVEKIPLSSVELRQLTVEPEAGTYADANAIIHHNKNYGVSWQAWKESGSGDAFTGMFEWGKTYFYTLYVYPKDGYTFGANGTKVPVYLNDELLGEGTVEYALERDGVLALTLTRTFDTVKRVSLTVTEPVAGAAVIADGSPSAYPGYSIMSQGWHVGSVNGSPAGERFEPGKTYYYVAWLKPWAGCRFPGVSSGYGTQLMNSVAVNGTEVDGSDFYYTSTDSPNADYAGCVRVSRRFTVPKEPYAEPVEIHGLTHPAAGASLPTDAATDSAHCRISYQYWMDDSFRSVTDTGFVSGKYYIYLAVVAPDEGMEFTAEEDGTYAPGVSFDGQPLQPLGMVTEVTEEVLRKLDEGAYAASGSSIQIYKRYQAKPGLAITKLTRTGSSVFWALSEEAPSGARLVVAAYDDRGRMRCVTICDQPNTAESLTLNAPAASTLKAFLVDRNNAPLCTAYTLHD